MLSREEAERRARGVMLRGGGCDRFATAILETSLETRQQAIEECAGIAETLGVYPELNVCGGGPEWYKQGKKIAAKIRALEGKATREGSLNGKRPQRIGVHDYESLVGCLTQNFRRVFPEYPNTDPQDMVQYLAATVMEQRLKLESLQKQLDAANLGRA